MFGATLKTAWMRISLRWRIIVLLSAYAVVTAGVLGGLLLKLRDDAIGEDKKLLTAIAQLADEQTSRTLQNIDQAILTVAAMLPVVRGAPGSPAVDRIDAQLGKITADRPYLYTIRVLDERGHAVYNSDSAFAGLDLSDRAYFQLHRDNQGIGLQFGAPVRNRSADKWIIPVTRAVRGPNGAFAGLIVAALDPMFFDRVWSVDGDIKKLSVTLFRASGEMLMRSPFSEKLIGKSYTSEYVFQQLRAGNLAGTFQNFSAVDGMMRFFAYRQLTAFPSLVLVTGQAEEQVLHAWRQTVWIVVVGWLVAALALAVVASWLIREWRIRQASQDRYHVLFNANPYPMVVMDRETRGFLDVNDAAIKEYGWSRQECLAMTANVLYSPADLATVTALRQADPSGIARVVEGLRHLRKDGTSFDVEMHTSAIELDGKSAILTTAENVSPRHLAQEQLRQSQKMEAVGQLTGGIAHDFNNILFVILANADALLEEEDLSPDVQDRLGRIDKAVQRAAELTRQLMAFSRKQALTPRPTDLNDLVSGTSQLLHRALGEHIVIEQVLAQGLWTVNIDRSQLETALVNLCLNARDAMPGGGKLVIETRNVILDKDNVTQATDVAPGDYAMLSVSDTGSGMSDETRAKVFEPFFTTKEVGKGTGLGLSMVYGFIKQSSGHITIHSKLGVGTTFRLYLPRCDGQQEEAAARKADPMPRGSERILVVEDESLVRASVVEQLRNLGYAVTEAPDGTAALASFEAAAQPFDLLLTDVVMPGPMTGKALADAVARRWPSTRVVFVSGYAENALLHEGKADAGVLLLSKPFRKADLARIIRQALDGAAVG
jgi:PAS domain S-box-containing protein